MYPNNLKTNLFNNGHILIMLMFDDFATSTEQQKKVLSNQKSTKIEGQIPLFN